MAQQNFSSRGRQSAKKNTKFSSDNTEKSRSSSRKTSDSFSKKRTSETPKRLKKTVVPKEKSFDKPVKSFDDRNKSVKKNQPVNQKPSTKISEKSIRLNKYLANAGVCSRREADVFIKAGNVTVNGKIITEMGFQVMPQDEVRFDNTSINPETKRYVLLNKPKDYITTLDDEKGRKTVMDLVSNACKERIYPVGRLDRNTTGLLLFTNDGDLAKKLTHPKHNIHKLYHVTLDKNVTAAHLKEIIDPDFKVEDLPVYVDSISYVENSPKSEIGIEIHSGRNRIVRKIFESLGYNVLKLDRVIFAGLTKKDLPKGRWRHLTEQEIINLKVLK